MTRQKSPKTQKGKRMTLHSLQLLVTVLFLEVTLASSPSRSPVAELMVMGCWPLLEVTWESQ